MQNHSLIKTMEEFEAFYQNVKEGHETLTPYEIEWKNYVSINDEFKRYSFDPSCPDDEIFNYFCGKYAYDIFTKEDILEFANLETYNFINYTCDYLSSISTPKEQNTTSKKSNASNNVSHFFFYNAQATHTGLIYKKNKRYFCKKEFEVLAKHLLNSHSKILLDYPSRTDTAFHIKNFLGIERVPLSTISTVEKQSDNLSPSEFFLYERMTNINSIAVLTYNILSFANASIFEPIYSKTFINDSYRINYRYLKPIHNLIDILAHSPLSHSKSLILEHILNFQFRNSISSIETKNYFTYDEEKQFVSDQKSMTDTKSNNPSFKIEIEKDSVPASFKVIKTAKFGTDFSAEYPVREFNKNLQGTKKLFDLTKNEEYKIYFTCAVLEKILNFVAEIVQHQTYYLLHKYINQAIVENISDLKIILQSIKSDNNRFIYKTIENSSNLKGFATNKIIISNVNTKQKTTDAMDDINEYVHDYLIHNHKAVVDLNFLRPEGQEVDITLTDTKSFNESNLVNISPSKETSYVLTQIKNAQK